MPDQSRARDRMVDVQIARRGVRDRDVLAAMRAGAARGLRRARLRGIRLRGQPAADRRRPDDLAALHRRADDRGGRGEARRPRARDRRRLGLCRRRAEPRSPTASTRSSAIASLAEAARRALRARSATTTSSCASATAPWAGPRRRRSTPSWSPPADRRCRGAARSSSRSAAGWSSRSATDERTADAAQGHAHGRRRFEEEDLGAVTFVPLIGEQGWAEDGAPRGHATTCPAARARIAAGDDRRGGRAAAGLRRSRLRPSCSTASPIAASCCSARRATAPPSSIAPARRSRAG